ncbi:MAG TPA: BamA/TamA family outer membrane protein, partial [Polyangiaceae bacterium]
LPPPPGYQRGYTLAKSELTVTYDQRKLSPARRAGVFGGVRGAFNSELRTRGSFVTYGGKAGGFLDLNDHGRVLSLAASARFADPLAGSEIPFTELVTLGGLEPMRAYAIGRLVDRSSAVGELAYRWPIWIWLNGALRGEVGNVFGERLSGFSAGKLRWSGTLGIESTNPAETGFEMLFGVGSETFESGGKVDSFRFVIGTTNGI